MPPIRERLMTAPRVAVTHFAGRAGDHNDRAMAASPRLARALAEHFDVPPSVVGVPREALSTGWEIELNSAREDLSRMQELHAAILDDGAIPVTALSRCAVALATLPVVAARHPDAVVVWFDAHADVHTPETSRSGFLGGLALSGALGWWDSGLGAGLAPWNTVLAGARDIEPAEAAMIQASGVSVVPPGADFAERLRGVVDGRAVYVHIDCDVLDPGIVPTDYRVPDGLSLDDLHAAAAALAESPILGLQIGELETEHGAENLAPLLRALAPLLDAAMRG